ncbi:helix-turn-helix domain-containing protein [Paenibacillus lycopersici]|uniref:Helix-turn-helix domain-containing protein n=1 Tax=Paenibacillus lycopersici TaxID=2704462 RepID=A0A6C0FQN6_9BACL|nr:helix-turn-helix domain-containing protein [Paenibacillus lycopersici]QHT59197.1 helix-turn-helix domain-containing protein [Paenibacillus lycopersici]
MTLSAVVFQHLKTPLAVVVIDHDDDCRFDVANKAFARLVGCSEDVLEGLPPERLFTEWDRSALQSSNRHETTLLRHSDGDHPPRLLLTCEALADTKGDAFLLTAEDISANSWIDRLCETQKVLIAGILNERYAIERMFKYYPTPVFDNYRFPVGEPLDAYLDDDERERLISVLELTSRQARTHQIAVRTKALNDGVQLDLNMMYRPFCHTDGSLKHIAFIVSDIRSAADSESNAADSSVTLKVLMARSYMSAQQLSAATGISMQTISKLRNGKINKPQRQTALLIAQALKVAPQDIWP